MVAIVTVYVKLLVSLDDTLVEEEILFLEPSNVFESDFGSEIFWCFYLHYSCVGREACLFVEASKKEDLIARYG